MTNKERVHAALEGKPVDRCPVTSLYNFLYHDDHFSELTGLPQWKLAEWLASSPEKYIDLFAKIHAKVPFETLQPQYAPPRSKRERIEFVEKDGHGWRHDKTTDEWTQLDLSTDSGHASDYHANETRHILDIADVNEQVKVTPAEQMIAEGLNDYIDATVSRFGKDEFILSGGVIGTLYSCHFSVGLTNLFSMLVEEPELIDYLSKKLLEKNIEDIRRMAAGGGDAIYIDDATSTCDMISLPMYERFSLPYMTEMVKEIHNLGHKAILIYFGGIADRIEQIASTGADGLLFEASMKGFVNDTEDFAARVGDRITLFSNIDPVSVLQDGSDAELEAEIQRQARAIRNCRGFIFSTASPITPSTPVSRVQKFIELSKHHGMAARQGG